MKIRIIRDLLILHLFQIFLDFTSVIESNSWNVAQSKSAKYCYFHETPTVTDGETHFQISEILDLTCVLTPYANFVLDLKEYFSIQYVIVYQGLGLNKGELDYIRFKLIDKVDNPVGISCGEYPFAAPGPSDVKLRVNCVPTEQLWMGIQMNSHLNVGFAVAELEVYTLAKDLPGDSRNVLLYRGCFKNFGEKENKQGLWECQSYCLKDGHLFMGIKDGKNCRCGDTYDVNEELPQEYCYMRCDDGYRFCGSEDGYSVYSIKPPLPYYNGCFDVLIQFPSNAKVLNDLTVIKCLKECLEYRYAKLQNGNQCICSDLINELLAESNLCDVKCPGNPSETCGGESHLAIYSTCKQGNKGDLKCSDYFQCATELSFDVYGTCSPCKPSYIGEFCIELEAIDVTTPKTTENLKNVTKPMDSAEDEGFRKYTWYFLILVTIICLGIMLCGGDETSVATAASAASEASATSVSATSETSGSSSTSAAS